MVNDIIFINEKFSHSAEPPFEMTRSLSVLLFCLLSPFLLSAQNSGTLTFTNVKAYGFTVSFNSAVSDADGFLFLRATQEIDENFLDQNLSQTLPQRGSSVGFAKVFQSSAPPLFNVRETVENTDYYFALVPYRLNGSVATFVNDSALFAHRKSEAADPGNYYDGIDFTSATLLDDLTQLLQNHTFVDYGDYKSTMVQTIFERDTTNNQKVVNCEYSNEVKIYSGAFDFVALDYSREHLLPRSWYPTTDAIPTPEGSDYHNLALTNLGDVNSLRSNFPYGEVVSVSDSYLECSKGQDANQNTVFEPRDEKKGDAARAMFYQLICYNGKSGSWGFNHLPSLGDDQNVPVLLNWHFNDLPDAFEKAKHEYIATLQGNRNPFIDYPELAGCIDFSELLKSGTCAGVGMDEQELEASITIFPNPATDFFSLRIDRPGLAKHFNLCDLTGKVLSQQEISVNESTTTVPLGDLASGLYLGIFTLENGTTLCKKLQVVRP